RTGARARSPAECSGSGSPRPTTPAPHSSGTPLGAAVPRSAVARVPVGVAAPRGTGGADARLPFHPGGPFRVSRGGRFLVSLDAHTPGATSAGTCAWRAGLAGSGPTEGAARDRSTWNLEAW